MNNPSTDEGQVKSNEAYVAIAHDALGGMVSAINKQAAAFVRREMKLHESPELTQPEYNILNHLTAVLAALERGDIR